MSLLFTNQAKRPVWSCLAGMLTVLVCTVSSAHADGIAVEEDQHGEASVTNDGRLLLKVRTQPSPMKLYVSQLFTPQGTQVLRDSPHDHVHHHALDVCRWDRRRRLLVRSSRPGLWQTGARGLDQYHVQHQ